MPRSLNRDGTTPSKTPEIELTPDDSSHLRDQLDAALRKVEELSKANDAMRCGIERLVRLQDPDLALGEMLRTAAEVAGAQTGAVALLEPDGTHYRFAALLERGGNLEIQGSKLLKPTLVTPELQSWMNGMVHSPDGWPLAPDDPLHTPETVAFHKSQGNQALRHIPMIADGRLVGWLGLGFVDPEPALGDKYTLLKTLADEMTMAVEMLRLADGARNASIAREKEQAAEERSRELARINASLRESVDAVSQSADFDQSLAEVVLRVCRMAEASVAYMFGYDSQDNTLRTEFWIENDTIHWGVDPTSPPTLRRAFDADITPAFRHCVGHRQVFYANLNRMDEETRAGTWPGLIEWHLANGRPAACAIPVVAGEAPLGVIGLAWHEERSFSSEQQEMLLTLSNHAALLILLRQMERKTRLSVLAAEREKAAQERAAALDQTNRELELRNRLLSVVAEVATRLARIGDSNGGLHDALGLIGEAGQFSRVLILEERARDSSEKGSDHVVIAEWCAPGIRTHEECGTSVIASDVAEPFLTVLRSGKAFWCGIEDVAYPLTSVFESMGIRATGCAPLLLDGVYWGTVAFDDCVRSDPWDMAHVDALTAIAQAISNALQTRRDAERLASERERSAKQRAQELIEINSQLRDNLLTLSEGGDAHKTLQHILSSALRQLQARGSCVFTLDELEQTLQITSSADIEEPADTALLDRMGRCAHPFPLDSLPLWKRFVAKRDAVVMDVREDRDAALLRAGARQWHLDHDRPVIVAVPLAVANRLLGYLSITFDRNHTVAMISADQIRMAQSLASLAAMTIETERLAKRAQDAAIAEDRNRLAQELHDTLAGAFTGIFMQLQAASDLPDSEREQRKACIVRAEDLARNGLRQVREFVHTLTINGEDRWKAVEVMRKIVSDSTAGTGMAGTFVVRGKERLLKATVAHALQRILQEAIGNAQRYANGTKVETTLLFEEESVRLVISDNGAGFDEQAVSDTGFGIPGMRTRVARLAGTFSLDSKAGRGTTITVRLPEPYEAALQ